MTPSPKPSWRKGAGILIILSLILIWAALVASLAPIVGKWPEFVKAAFYLFVGIVWIIPLKPLIQWTETGSWRAPSKPKD